MTFQLSHIDISCDKFISSLTDMYVCMYVSTYISYQKLCIGHIYVITSLVHFLWLKICHKHVCHAVAVKTNLGLKCLVQH